MLGFRKKKKKTLGFQPKPRTVEEINKEYQQHAILLGHAVRLVQELQEQIDRLEAEQSEHLLAMRRANIAAKEIQASPQPPAPVVQSETGTPT